MINQQQMQTQMVQPRTVVMQQPQPVMMGGMRGGMMAPRYGGGYGGGMGMGAGGAMMAGAYVFDHCVVFNPLVFPKLGRSAFELTFACVFLCPRVG